MTDTGLQPGDAIQCNHCGEVHVLKGTDGGDTSSAARALLFCHCTKPTIGLYYVGNVGGQSNRGPVMTRDESKGGRDPL